MEDKKDVTTPESLSDDVDVASADGEGAASEQVSEQVSIKDILGKELGKTFESDEAALKSVKDTFSFVGKAGKARQALDVIKNTYHVDEEGALKIMENIKPSEPQKVEQTQSPNEESEQKIDTSKFVSREEFETQMFYKDNPDAIPFKKVINAISKSEGLSPSDVWQQEDVQQLVSKAKAYDESESSKSVIMSNPKLGAATDKLSQAKEAAQSGNFEAAGELATKAVMDAYEIQ